MRPVRERKRSLRIPCLATAALLVCAYASWALFPQPSVKHGDSVVVVFPTPLADAVTGSELVVALFAFVLGFITLLRRERIGWLPLLASIAFLPVVFVTSDDSSFNNWSDEASVLLPGIGEYHLLAQRWLEGDWAIARLSEVGPLQRRYEILVTGTMADFGDGLRVVRPSGSPKADGLFVAPNMMVVGVDADGLASVAYDPWTDFRYGLNSSSSRNLRPIASLSPFLLLGPSTIPDPSDVAKLRKPESEGMRATEADLKSPNPAVRRLARRLLADAGGSGK